MLTAYGFHGFGDPENDAGIVVFSADKVVFKEVVIGLPDWLNRSGWWFEHLDTKMGECKNIEEFKNFLKKCGKKENRQKILSWKRGSKKEVKF